MNCICWLAFLSKPKPCNSSIKYKYKYCSAWRKALRKIWELPQDFRSHYLAIVSDCTPIFDEICRRSLNFIDDGMRSDSNIIRFITEHTVYHARSASPLGRNVVLCCLRYGRTFGQLTKQKWRHQLFDAQSLSYFSQDDYSYIYVLYLNY